MPPIVVNVPAAEGLPGWVAPAIGVLGVLIGIVGNNLWTKSREETQYRRDKKFELYLELQNSEYEIRKWMSLNAPVRPDFLDKNSRWASLQLRMAMFASPDVEKLGNEFWRELHKWLIEARDATTGEVELGELERAQLIEKAARILAVHGRLFTEIRKDLGAVPRGCHAIEIKDWRGIGREG